MQLCKAEPVPSSGDIMARHIVTDLKGAAKDTNHEHDHRQIVGEHIPPRLQDSERRLLFRELPEFHYRNHDACQKRMEVIPQAFFSLYTGKIVQL